jgi:hypothetical protein
LLEKLDAGRARDAQELAIRTALTGPLLAVRSLVGPEIEFNSERLKELCEQAGETQNLALALAQLFFFHRSATSREKAGTFSRRALELAAASRGEFEIFMGNFMSGMLTAEQGNYLAALPHLEQAVEISQQAKDLILANPKCSSGFPQLHRLSGNCTLDPRLPGPRSALLRKAGRTAPAIAPGQCLRDRRPPFQAFDRILHRKKGGERRTVAENRQPAFVWVRSRLAQILTATGIPLL